MGFKNLEIAAIVAIGIGLGACSEDDGAMVRMESGQRFEPELLTVSVNETVTFVNESPDAHTVTAYEDGSPEGAAYFASGGFESEGAARDDLAEGLLSSGESFEVRFESPGTYRYFCIPHESSGMTGRLVVEE
jgi:plastocyanin